MAAVDLALWDRAAYSITGTGEPERVQALLATDGLLPLIGAPVYLTFRSYSIYIDRLAADQRHSDEVMRLHNDAVTALEAAKRSEQRYALAAARMPCIVPTAGS